MKKLLIRMLQLVRFNKPYKHRQTTFCYCPGCKEDLCSNQSEFADDGEVVRYKCPCGADSRWLFSTPVPILLRTTPGSSNE